MTLRACVASTDFVLILVQKLIAHSFQDLQVLTGGIGVRLRKEFTAESCKSKDRYMNYTMEARSNTVWDNNNFSVLPLSTR